MAANQGTKDKPSTTVSIIDTASFAVVGSVEAGRGAHGVVNIYGDDVSVIDIEAQKVIATIPSGAGPNGISFSPVAPAVPAAPQIEITMPDLMDGMDMGG